MMLKKINRTSLNLVYICFMVVYMTVREILPLNFLIDSTLVSALIFAPALVLIVWDLFTAKNCVNGHLQDLLILFLAVCCVSSVINMKFGIFGNVKIIAALAIEYFVFFCYTKNMPSEKMTKHLNVISTVLIVTWLIPVLFSLAAYFFGIDVSVQNYGAFEMTSQGFSYQYVRLWGVFQDPNYASIVSLVCIFASVRLIAQTKRVFSGILLGINVLLQLCYIVLGGSRAALLLSTFAAVLFVLFRFIFAKRKKGFWSFCKSTAAAVLAFAFCVGTFVGCKSALPRVKNILSPITAPTALQVSAAYDMLYSLSGVEFELVQYGTDGKVIFETDPDPAVPHPPVNPPGGNSQGTIDRTDLEKGDISNGRFERWKQTIQVFLNAPFFGTSPRNLAAFAKVHNPETMMAKYGMAPHNGYLDVLVETGIVGFLVLASAVLLALFSFLKRFLKEGFSYDRALPAISALVFMGLAMFISDIYVSLSINAMFFWLFLGFAYNMDKQPENGGFVFTLLQKCFGKKG